MKIRWAGLLAGALLMLPGLVLAGARSAAKAPHGSREEAKAMVEKAVRWVRERGTDRTLAEITLAGTDKKGEFIDRDLYVFVYDFRGVCLAHGANPKLVGRNLWDLVDADGSYLIRGLVETARQGSGWYRYKWSNPLTKKIEEKLAYVKKVDEGLWLGSGVYGAQVSR